MKQLIKDSRRNRSLADYMTKMIHTDETIHNMLTEEQEEIDMFDRRMKEIEEEIAMEEQQKQFDEVEPRIWKPENPGDSVQGVYVSRKDDVGINKSKMYILDTKEGLTKVWGSTVLDDRMDAVQAGQYVRITFKELKENKRGQPIKIFKVEVARETPQGSQS